MAVRYAIIIQCELAHRKCSGYACTEAFYSRTGQFEGLEDGVRYISFNCGGCCGKSASAKLAHFVKMARKKEGFKPEEAIVYLSSCMTTDNHHYDRCPHAEYIRDIVRKRGFSNVVEGTYISKNASSKRAQGIYRSYPPVDAD